MVGLQGSGKTTTSAKIAKRLTERQNKKVLMASLDTRRPAAQEQLRQLGEQVEVATLPIVAGQTPVEIARRAVQAAKLGGHDVVILDTAGRTHIDEPLMVEMAEIKRCRNPHEILLVADSLTGQDAVNLAKSFDERVGITGLVLTRMDGDGRGGAALSMRAVTGKPIKLIGTGEKMDGLEEFHPKRIADRILGMGDIVSLVEKAAENIDAEKAAAMAKKMQSGKFDLNDLAGQLQQMSEDGRHGRHHGHDARHGQDEGPDGRRRPRRQDVRPPARHHLVDDQGRARQPRPAQAFAQEAHRRRLRHRCRRDQQAAEDASRHGRHDEGDGRQGQRRRPDAQHDGRPCRQDGPRRHDGAAGQMGGGMPDLSKMDPKQLEALQKQAQAAGLGGMKGLPGSSAAAACPACPAA